MKTQIQKQSLPDSPRRVRSNTTPLSSSSLKVTSISSSLLCIDCGAENVYFSRLITTIHVEYSAEETLTTAQRQQLHWFHYSHRRQVAELETDTIRNHQDAEEEQSNKTTQACHRLIQTPFTIHLLHVQETLPGRHSDVVRLKKVQSL